MLAFFPAYFTKSLGNTQSIPCVFCFICRKICLRNPHTPIVRYCLNDENRIEFYDSAHSLFEDRYNTIGKVDEILFVVYTERKALTRIISARIATPAERRMYNDRKLFHY